jgi:multidrug efflux pump
MRQVLGTAVFFGMLGVTIFGLFLTPAFYVVIRGLSGKKLQPHGAHTASAAAPTHPHKSADPPPHA